MSSTTRDDTSKIRFTCFVYQNCPARFTRKKNIDLYRESFIQENTALISTVNSSGKRLGVLMDPQKKIFSMFSRRRNRYIVLSSRRR
ncbi:hypothetical protein RhiirB3_398881 [Rhizophagus irregularis]|nr:hypothetical protein RhiirB3_398881 [Rhizophagus irregularis]